MAKPVGAQVLGITGHQNLTPETAALVANCIDHALEGCPPMRGVTSLAAGADQIFAQRLLHHGGAIVAILPSRDYVSTFTLSSDRREFEVLLSAADEVVELPFASANEEAFWAAGQEVVRRCDRLLAVWDGEAAGGLGGTGDVIAYARQVGREVTVIWPEGAQREQKETN